MFRNMKAVLVCVSCCFLFLAGHAVISEAATADAVKTVRYAQLQKMIKENTGKMVVVNFFATWCPPCRKEIPGLVSISKSMEDSVAIIGVSLDDTPDILPAFLKQMEITYPVVHGREDISARYEVSSIPHNVIYDTTGKMIAAEAGFITEEELKTFLQKHLEQK